jgi:hypothetical protein
LNTNVFCSYSCGGGGGMNSSGSGASGTGGTGLTSFFDGGASAEWGSGKSGYGGLNAGGAIAPVVLPTGGTDPSGTPGTRGGSLGGAYLSPYSDGCLGGGGCGGFGSATSVVPPGSGSGGYVKLRLY